MSLSAFMTTSFMGFCWENWVVREGWPARNCSDQDNSTGRQVQPGNPY